MASYLLNPEGRVAERQGTGLQNLQRRFESAHDLKDTASAVDLFHMASNR
jgi:hypothetical protein